MNAKQPRTRPGPGPEAKVQQETETDLDHWNPEMDRKLRKRIQNRLAQRTYRSRMRQRIDELERQVEAQQRAPSPKTATTATAGQVAMDGRGNGSGRQVQEQETMMLDAWIESAETAASRDQNYMLWSGADLGLPPGTSTVSPSFEPSAFSLPGSIAPNLVQSSRVSSSEDMKNGWRNSPWPMAERAFPRLSIEPREGKAHATSVAGAGSSMVGSRSSARVTDSNTQSQASSPSQCSRLASPEAPSGDTATVEERIGWVLECARRVGFAGLDDLALQYYTRNFDGHSSLALEQRMSRQRSLPTMVAELRRSCEGWSAWQSRGYLDEVLKSAEEICAAECAVLGRGLAQRGDDAPITEIALQDRLPHLWAFLTRLASTAAIHRHQNPSRAVFVCLLILCGLQQNTVDLNKF
ncbi:hypothetical protein HFD88_004198 [Aspergillus terreus]|nr:hypothetical protein HFD88_004198 [Aspergillus terreus]